MRPGSRTKAGDSSEGPVCSQPQLSDDQQRQCERLFTRWVWSSWVRTCPSSAGGNFAGSRCLVLTPSTCSASVTPGTSCWHLMVHPSSLSTASHRMGLPSYWGRTAHRCRDRDCRAGGVVTPGDSPRLCLCEVALATGKSKQVNFLVSVRRVPRDVAATLTRGQASDLLDATIAARRVEQARKEGASVHSGRPRKPWCSFR